MIFAYQSPDWEDHIDSFTPLLDEKYFPLLLAEAKSTCFVNLKQSPNSKVESQYRQQKALLQNDKHRISKANSNPWPNFGRR
jgi:hypothetical protein